MQFIINKLMGLREEQKKLFDSHPEYNLGDVTTVNLTMLSGGVQHNVVPNELKVAFDIRLTPRSDVKAFEKQLFDWAAEVCRFVFLR
jgi:aminoacylase